MKRLFKLGLLALMGVCGFVGISRADGETGETTTPGETTTTTLTSPTFTPATGATITPQSEIEFTLPANINVADYNGGAFILYVENKPTVALETTTDILYGALTAAMTPSGPANMDDNEAAADPEYEIAVLYSIEDDGSDVMTLVPVKITTESGEVAFRARLALIGRDDDGNDIVLYSEVMTADYTVAGEVVVVKPTAPTFSLEAGLVDFKAQLTLSNGYSESEASLYPMYYIKNGNNTDFTNVTNANDKKDLQSYTAGEVILINGDMTILAATAKIDNATGNITWSDIVPKTYTIPAAPAIDKAAGAYDLNTEITVAKGEADNIFVATGKNVEAATTFAENTADVKVTLTADTVVRAYAVKNGKHSDTVVRAYTIKSDEDPEPATPGVFTITPAPTATAMEAGTKLALSYSGEHDAIYYGWFADAESAKAAEFDGGNVWAMYVAPNFVPELTGGKPALRVLALDEDDEIIADSVVVYVVNAAPVAEIEFTFTPESGSRVAPGTKISVETEALEDGFEIDYKWFASKEEADAAEWEGDWNSTDMDLPETALERGIDKDTLYLKVALVKDVNFDDEGNVTGTAIGYGQASYIVDIELIDKIVVTPANGTLVRENDSVSIEVKFGSEAKEGTLVYKMYASMNDATADMDLLGTAQTYNAALKPVITRENPVLAAGYKNAEGWVIEPVTVEYFFDPSVTEFTVAAAGKNTMKENTVEFDGMASFKMKVDGDVIKGLKIAAKVYSKDYKDTITTDGYEATDTLAPFVGIYNGEYVVNFSLRHAYAAGKDSVLADTTIYFNVTNYEEPVDVNPELSVKAVGAEGENVVFNEKNVAFDMFVKNVVENDTLVVTIYTKEEYDSMKTVAPQMRAKVADSVRFSTTLEYGEYVGVFSVVRKSDKVGEVVAGEAVTINFTVKEKEQSANEAAELAGVNVYPNPNAGTFNVAVPERARIDIFGLNGAKVLSREVNAGVEAFQLNHSGIYFVRVMAGNKTAVKRVVVR